LNGRRRSCPSRGCETRATQVFYIALIGLIDIHSIPRVPSPATTCACTLIVALPVIYFRSF